MLYKAIKKAHSQGGLKIASTAVTHFVVYQKLNLTVGPSDVLIFQTSVKMTLTIATKIKETKRGWVCKRNRPFPYFSLFNETKTFSFLLEMVSKKRNGPPMPCYIAVILFPPSQF